MEEHARRFARGMVRTMSRFQRVEGTVNKCVANTLYLYDSLRISFPLLEVRVKPVLVHIPDEEKETNYFNMGHLVVEFNGEILDPSYEINKHENRRYFHNISEFASALPDNYLPQEKMREVITNFLKFIQIAEKIHNEELISDKEYYNRQADYIDSQYR